MIKPYQIFLLLLIVFILLIIPSFLVPSTGLNISSRKIYYPEISYFLRLHSSEAKNQSLVPEVAYLDKIIDTTDIISLVLDSITKNKQYTSSEIVVDTIAISTDNSKQFNIDWLKSKLVRLEFPDSTRSSLDTFFEALRSGETNRNLVRIIHYGDSQIEGDRITSFLRKKFQNRFGGTGIGLMHIEPGGYQTGTVSQLPSSNWELITLLDKDLGHPEINRYSAFGGYSRFTSPITLFSSGGTPEAWIQIKRTGNKNNPARNFTRFKLFFGYNSKPFLLELKISGETIDADMISPAPMLKQLNWDIPASYKSFDLKFTGDDSPMIFGISLESEKGIVVDNIPLRGSSGTEFTRNDISFMKDMLNSLNTKLIILQFGVNVVPNIVADYRYYENLLYKQIVALKNAKPNVSIVLVGVSDVSRKEGMEYNSYPNIEKIRDAQRKAAFRAGIPFWDCYKAMGGKNSMTAWTFANPPLANKDFIHFTPRGARLIAEMFYSALMAEYEIYLDYFGQSQISYVSGTGIIRSDHKNGL